MATPESTTTPASPALARNIQFDRATRDYAMFLDGDLVGFARTYHQGELTLDSLVAEILALRARRAVAALPLPPMDAVAATLDEQSRAAADPTLLTEARAQLAAGVTLVADGPALWIDSMLVLPNPSAPGWPWVCPCEARRCWHAALAEALTITRERLLELVGDDAPLVCEVAR